MCIFGLALRGGPWSESPGTQNLRQGLLIQVPLRSGPPARETSPNHRNRRPEGPKSTARDPTQPEEGYSNRPPRWGTTRGSSRCHCGKGFDTGPPQVGAGFLSLCGFSLVLVVFLGLPAGFPTLPALLTLGSVFLWRCFFRQKPPCNRNLVDPDSGPFRK